VHHQIIYILNVLKQDNNYSYIAIQQLLASLLTRQPMSKNINKKK